MIKRVGFLLINPQLPENIGFCARALKNFGFKKLDIVNPKEKWPNKRAIATSVGASDILKKTKIYSSLKVAANNYDIIYASTARKRDINKKHLSFKQFIENIKKNFDIITTVRKNRLDKVPSILLSGLKVYDLIFDKLLNKKLKTYRSPFAAYKKKYVQNLPWYKNDHRYLIPIAIHRGASKIAQIEVAYNKRNSGKSHYNRRLKVFFGVIEVIVFIFKMKLGKYN